mmetsp:Transcript_15746/g.54858  ORF Transcript_15746/g.54858 Transcript_15746/m.54858 type:complete len:207 (+) Transcript_15746:1332-1952(+)
MSAAFGASAAPRPRSSMISKIRAAWRSATRLVARLARWKFASAAAACNLCSATGRRRAADSSLIRPPPARSESKSDRGGGSSVPSSEAWGLPSLSTTSQNRGGTFMGPSSVITVKLVGASTTCSANSGVPHRCKARSSQAGAEYGCTVVEPHCPFWRRGVNGSKAVNRYLDSTSFFASLTSRCQRTRGKAASSGVGMGPSTSLTPA